MTGPDRQGSLRYKQLYMHTYIRKYFAPMLEVTCES